MQIPEKSEVLSDNYTVVENDDDVQTETKDALENDPWNAQPKEPDEDSNNREMLENLRSRRKEYDTELPPKAKALMDEVLAIANPDPKAVSGMIDRLDKWEDETKARGK